MLQRNDIANITDMANITYDGMSQFILATANNPFFGHSRNTVNAQSLGNVFAVIEVGKDDIVTVGQNGSLAGIQGDVRIQGALGQVPKQVTLDDSGNTTAYSPPRSVTLGSDPTFGYLVSGLANGSLGRGHIGLLLDPTTPVAINTGASNQVFHVMDCVGVPALSLNAGGGNNTLNYSAYTGDIKVNLLLGTATGLAGVSGIQNVTGGIGNDLIDGGGSPGHLVGGTGRNILISGAGGGTLDASNSTEDNILIGGTTDYDTWQAALDAIFTEWTRTDLSPQDSFQIRFGDLSTGLTVGGQLVMLSKQTVHANSVPDKLICSNRKDPATSKRVHNWFFHDGDDTLVNFMKPDDHETTVK
jgi:hypothetical protein